MKTKQMEFWSGSFGQEYTERNNYDLSQWDKLYFDNYGLGKLEIFKQAFDGLDKEIKILEVGCNIGMQLRGLHHLGFKNLYGVDLQVNAVKEAHEKNPELNIIQGSAFDLPFKDHFFDLVMTNGVLIHIAPKDIANFMGEVKRTSKKYIYGHEYFDEKYKEIKYRGHDGFMWKGNFAKMYCDQFHGLKIQIDKRLPYIKEGENGNCDNSFLISI